jgi:hypothetical protein
LEHSLGKIAAKSPANVWLAKPEKLSLAAADVQPRLTLQFDARATSPALEQRPLSFMEELRTRGEFLADRVPEKLSVIPGELVERNRHRATPYPRRWRETGVRKLARPPPGVK